MWLNAITRSSKSRRQFPSQRLETQCIYYAADIAAAGARANTVTVTFNTEAYPDLRILEYAGAAPTNPVEIVAGATGISTNSTVSLTTASAGNLIFRRSRPAQERDSRVA